MVLSPLPLAPMPYSSPQDAQLQLSIQQSLQDIAVSMNHPISEETAAQLYTEAADLLNHIDYAPITLVRVAGTLLVYRVQAGIEPEEVDWFKAQIQQCPDDTEVEEVIESLHRADAL